MKRWQWALLIFELALFVIILILPNVALPDFTFHGGTAPVAARARVSSIPVYALALSVLVLFVGDGIANLVEANRDAAPLTLDCRLSLLCTLVC